MGFTPYLSKYDTIFKTNNEKRKVRALTMDDFDSSVVESSSLGSGGQVGGGTRKPSRKMVEWANSIADNIGEDYPEEALKNGDALYAWITANKDRRIFKPTEKQIAFAENIALAMGGEIPDELRDNAKALSAWIDDHKDALGTEPTEKQLNAAEKIAERKGIELPEECRTDRKAMSAWLDKNMDRRDDTPVPSGKKKGKK